MAQNNDLSNAAIALLRVLVDEFKSAAHDPATVHLVADKLKNGIDALEHALTTPEQDAPKQ